MIAVMLMMIVFMRLQFPATKGLRKTYATDAYLRPIRFCQYGVRYTRWSEQGPVYAEVKYANVIGNARKAINRKRA